MAFWLQRMAAVPHRESMLFLKDGCTIDPSCYWHGTVTDLRQDDAKVYSHFTADFQPFELTS